MTTYQPSRMPSAVLLVLLLMPIATAGHESSELPQKLVLRNLYLSDSPQEEAPEVSVAGRISTTLRFETPCDPARTKLLGWEDRFEPLLVGTRSVVVTPLRNLTRDDGFLLLVTLTDGTSLPFTLVAASGPVDAQINVFPNQESPGAVRMALEDKRREVQELRTENERREQEESSVDHALAALLANGAVSKTRFRQREKWAFQDAGLKAEIFILDDHERSAIIFQMTNLDRERPWKLSEARLSTLATSEPKPFALRMQPSEILPRKTGRIAVVTDMPSFDAQKGAEKLVLELFRDGGRREGYVVLEARPQR